MAVAMKTGGRIESLLSARLFLNPQLAGDKLYFVSDMAGRLSLYRMDVGGSVPEPLLPPGIALQNPELLGGYPFYALPEHDRIVLMLDSDGDENYQPNVIPLDGGFPEPLNEEAFSGMRTHLLDVDGETATGYAAAESSEEAKIFGMRIDLATGEMEILGEGMHGPYPGRLDARSLACRARRRLHGRRHRPLRARSGERREDDALGNASGRPRGGRRASAARPPVGARDGERARAPHRHEPLRRRLRPRLPPLRRLRRGGAGGAHRRGARGRRRAGAVPAHRRRPVPRRVQHRRRLVGVRGRLRRGRARNEARPRARGRRRARRRRPARHRPRLGERPLGTLVLHRDDADAAVRARRGRHAGAADAGAAARHRPGAAVGRARTRRSSPTTACGRPRGSTCRPRSSASRGRGRSSSTCTEGRRARSGRTSRGSRCRSSRRSRSRGSRSSSPTCGARPGTGWTT